MLVPGTVHVMDASRRSCARCGAPFPSEARNHPELEPGFGIARDLSNADGTRFFTPEQLAAPFAPYVLCQRVEEDP